MFLVKFGINTGSSILYFQLGKMFDALACHINASVRHVYVLGTVPVHVPQQIAKISCGQRVYIML